MVEIEVKGSEMGEGKAEGRKKFSRSREAERKGIEGFEVMIKGGGIGEDKVKGESESKVSISPHRSLGHEVETRGGTRDHYWRH